MPAVHRSIFDFAFHSLRPQSAESSSLSVALKATDHRKTTIHRSYFSDEESSFIEQFVEPGQRNANRRSHRCGLCDSKETARPIDRSLLLRFLPFPILDTIFSSVAGFLNPTIPFHSRKFFPCCYPSTVLFVRRPDFFIIIPFSLPFPPITVSRFSFLTFARFFFFFC